MSDQPISVRELLEQRLVDLEESLTLRITNLGDRLMILRDYSLQRWETELKSGDARHAAILATISETRAEMHRAGAAEFTRTEGNRQDLEKRLDEMNKLREQISQERALYVDRDRLDQTMKTRDAQLDALTQRIHQGEQSKANMDGRFTMLGIIMMGLSVFFNLIFAYLAHTFTK